jgi:opacity protein-like surface antigen
MSCHRLLPVVVLAFAASEYATADVRFGEHRSYGQFSIGAVFPDDLDLAYADPLVTASGSFEFNTGFAVSAAAGYYFADVVTLEVELGYRYLDGGTLSGTIDPAGLPPPVSGSLQASGDVHSLVGFVNAHFRPNIGDGVFPYIGGGIGGAWSEITLDSILGYPIEYHYSDIDFAAHGDAGIEFDVGSNVLLGVRYRYTWVDSGDFIVDDFTAHEALLTVRFPY